MPLLIRRPATVARLGYLSFVLIGWTGLLVPTVIRSIEADFRRDDAAIGVFYLLFSLGYASGSLFGGLATERFGRRAVLALAGLLHGLGFGLFAVAPSWELFLLAAVPAAVGGGALDGGVNGLFLDAYRTGRGRALNLLHLFFALGALIAPFVVGRLVAGGVDWRAIALADGVALVPVAVAFAMAEMPSGRHDRREPGRVALPLGRPLLLLALAIGAYVASEIGVSNWLVRFLEDAPVAVATAALSLLWAGLTLGRLVASRLGDRFDHLQFAIVASLASGIALAAAVVVEPLEPRIALFALAGFTFGPVYPMIMAAAGDRFPDRSAAASGFLGASAVAGSIVYPPVMGFLSKTVGLGAAMLGAAALAAGCGIALLMVGRAPVERARATLTALREEHP